MFYTLLVLPYEWKKNEIGNFNKLDLSGPENVASAKATVKTDTIQIQTRRLGTSEMPCLMVALIGALTGSWL